ncbi:hypothetical protein SpCBS45565_g05834 [Spizellomyces sp. 'palustris']|nr:hypothetical protein SpCBS45565_g05834 [Spizellomyces sp. 'palustris']
MSSSLTYVPVGPLSSFTSTEPFTCQKVRIAVEDDKTKSLAVFYRTDMNQFWAVNNICPHQGGALSRGSLVDIEDMGIKWGVAIVCPLHGWAFSGDTGECDTSAYVVDVHHVRVRGTGEDAVVEVSREVTNKHVGGRRRDFGGVAVE